MQLHLPRPVSALRKDAVTQSLRKSRGERVPRPPSASSCRVDWGSCGLSPKRIAVAGSETEGLEVARMSAQAWPSSTEMCLLCYGSACANGSLATAAPRPFASAGWLRSALPSGAGLCCCWGAGGAAPRMGFAGDPTPPAPADQELSGSGAVSNSLQRGETWGVLEGTSAWLWARSSKEISVFPFSERAKEKKKWVVRLCRSTALLKQQLFCLSPARSTVFSHGFSSSSLEQLQGEHPHSTWPPEGFFLLRNLAQSVTSLSHWILFNILTDLNKP